MSSHDGGEELSNSETSEMDTYGSAPTWLKGELDDAPVYQALDTLDGDEKNGEQLNCTPINDHYFINFLKIQVSLQSA